MTSADAARSNRIKKRLTAFYQEQVDNEASALCRMNAAAAARRILEGSDPTMGWGGSSSPRQAAEALVGDTDKGTAEWELTVQIIAAALEQEGNGA